MVSTGSRGPGASVLSSKSWASPTWSCSHEESYEALAKYERETGMDKEALSWSEALLESLVDDQVIEEAIREQLGW